jgi:hypothetical protein
MKGGQNITEDGDGASATTASTTEVSEPLLLFGILECELIVENSTNG